MYGFSLAFNRALTTSEYENSSLYSVVLDEYGNKTSTSNVVFKKIESCRNCGSYSKCGNVQLTGDIWEIYGRYMGDIWEIYGRYMGDIWEIYGS